MFKEDFAEFQHADPLQFRRICPLRGRVASLIIVSQGCRGACRLLCGIIPGNVPVNIQQCSQASIPDGQCTSLVFVDRKDFLPHLTEGLLAEVTFPLSRLFLLCARI